MAVRIEYQVQPHSFGWADFAIRTEDATVQGTTGYMRDSLGDLARLAVGLCQKHEFTSHVCFAMEPNSFSCQFHSNAQRVHVECRKVSAVFSDLAAFRADADINPPLLVGEEDHIQLAMNVCELVDQAWRQFGIVGYKQTWYSHGLPLAELLLLRLWLDRNPLVAEIAEHAVKHEPCSMLEMALLQAPLDLCRDGTGEHARRVFASKPLAND